jgi:hypothetical protein
MYSVGFGQEQPNHPKKTYISPDGKLYIQKDLPVYIWMSTSPGEESEKYRLHSEETYKYSNPMYFDTEGYNTVRSPSAVDTASKKVVYPMRDIIFEVYADSKSPVTKADFGESILLDEGGKLYVGSGATVSLSAKDKLSGVENIYFSVDGGPYKPYEGPISIDQEKEYLLKYYSVDHVGNVESVHERTIVLDKTAPVSKVEIDKDRYENIISGRSKITLSSNDKVSGTKSIFYAIDDGSEKEYKTPILAAYLSQDEHKIAFYAVDEVGNKEEIQTFIFYVDKTPPTIIEEIMGKSFFSGGKEFSSGKTRLKLTSFDNKAGVREVRYSVNEGEYELYDKPVFLTQASGVLRIKSYAVDYVNNRSSSQTANEKTTIPYIDLTGPQLSHVFNGPRFKTRDTLFISSKTQVSLKGADSESGLNRIEYTLNGGNPLEYSDAFRIDHEGYSEVNYMGFDNVDNTSSASFGIKVDNTGPSISYTFGASPLGSSDGLDIYPDHTVLFVAATDDVVGFKSMNYRLNNDPPREYDGMITKLPDGKNKVIITAFDHLGNTQQSEINFIIN